MNPMRNFVPKSAPSSAASYYWS